MYEKYVLNCPDCGRVEGYLASDVEEEDDSEEQADTLIEEEVFEGIHGPSTRLRCPQCGRWTSPDRSRPAD